MSRFARTYDDTVTTRRVCDEVYAMWCVARAEANEAYEQWCEKPGTISYAVYRAAEDRADAAEQAYVEACAELPALAGV